MSTGYLLYRPPAGHMLFGVVMKRLACCPGEALSFHFVVESDSSINP